MERVYEYSSYSSYSYYFHIIQKEQFQKIIFISSPRRSAIDNTVLRNVFFPWEVWQGGPRWIKYKIKINSNQSKLIEIDYILSFRDLLCHVVGCYYTLNYVLYVLCSINWYAWWTHAFLGDTWWRPWLATDDSVFCLDAGRLEICWWAACFGSTFRGCCHCVNAASLKSEKVSVSTTATDNLEKFGEIWALCRVLPGFCRAKAVFCVASHSISSWMCSVWHRP